jgi:hypothetical protein
VARAIPTGPRTSSDAYSAPFALTYDSGHVLPFIADSLVGSPRNVTVGYLGANAILEGMLTALVDGLGLERPLAVAKLDDMTSVEELARIADLFVIDLGVDASLLDRAVPPISPGQLPQFPAMLDRALDALDRLIEIERERFKQVRHPRRIVLVNSSTAFWDSYILTQFDCSYTTTHSRVRRATVKPAPDHLATRTAIARARRLMRLSSRRDLRDESLPIRPGEIIEIAELNEYRGFAEGWAHPEDLGIWTEGSRSELRFALDGIGEGDQVLTLFVGAICVAPDDSLRVDLLMNGERVAVRDFSSDSAGLGWRVDLPTRGLVDGKADLTLLIDEPHSPLALGWSPDDRRLGLRIRAVTLEQVDRSVVLGEEVVFSEGSGAERLLGDGWSMLEPTGVWTVGESARLILELTDIGPEEVDVHLRVAAFVTPHHPELEAHVLAGEQRLASEVFHYGADDHSLHFHLPAAAFDAAGRAVLDLHLTDPARPVDLGLSTDARRLGLHLRSLVVEGPRNEAAVTAGPGTLRRLLRRLRA